MSTIKVDNLQNASGGSNSTPEQIEQGRAKAWINFDGTGTVSIRDDYNVSSLTDVGTGQYTVNFTNALSNSNYAAVGMNHYGISHRSTTPHSTTAFAVVTYNTSTAANTDYDFNDVAFFGD